MSKPVVYYYESKVAFGGATAHDWVGGYEYSHKDEYGDYKAVDAKSIKGTITYKDYYGNYQTEHAVYEKYKNDYLFDASDRDDIDGGKFFGKHGIGFYGEKLLKYYDDSKDSRPPTEVDPGETLGITLYHNTDDKYYDEYGKYTSHKGLDEAYVSVSLFYGDENYVGEELNYELYFKGEKVDSGHVAADSKYGHQTFKVGEKGDYIYFDEIVFIGKDVYEVKDGSDFLVDSIKGHEVEIKTYYPPEKVYKTYDGHTAYDWNYDGAKVTADPAFLKLGFKEKYVDDAEDRDTAYHKFGIGVENPGLEIGDPGVTSIPSEVGYYDDAAKDYYKKPTKDVADKLFIELDHTLSKGHAKVSYFFEDEGYYDKYGKYVESSEQLKYTLFKKVEYDGKYYYEKVARKVVTADNAYDDDKGLMDIKFKKNVEFDAVLFEGYDYSAYGEGKDSSDFLVESVSGYAYEDYKHDDYSIA